METTQKLALLEELFEVDAGSLRADTPLSSLNWDSMAMLSLIALVNQHFGKRLAGTQLKSFKCVGEILAVMG